ncbi:MAG: glycoside hydrolase family 3 N-terminal domain-containing protein, partial [Bacteroidota bacterium]
MTRQHLRALGLGFFLLSSVFLRGQSNPSSIWADSILSEMTIDEKIGQLFIHATFSNKSEEEYRKIEQLIETRHLGGLIFMQGEPQMQARLVNRYQESAKIPLMISQDAEWGLSMRLKNVPRYPKNMTLGAIYDDSLIYELGRQMALDLKKVGVRMNFAPVMDVNNNPANPVINYRSFGENKYNVARKGIMLAKGLQTGGIIACAKHFPGHGAVVADSHHELPVDRREYSDMFDDIV